MGQWPVYFLLTFIIVFFNRDTCSVNVQKNERNVGTVLFDKGTSCNHCWTKEELVILTSRKAFQDLLPETDTSEMQDDQYIAKLFDFFDTCLSYVCNMAVGKTKHLILKSFADTIGGYLNSYVGPVTKIAFYAGNIKYQNVKKVFELTDELKEFLHTNGAGWAKPIKVEMFINVTPIVLPVKDGTACTRLIVDSASGSPKRIGRRRRRSKNRLERRASEAHNRKRRRSSPFIFLPYFDNDREPNSIALPFKDQNLWSLNDEKSVSVLSRYYETSVQCIKSKEDHEKLLADFDRDFNEWLLQSVYPRLSDDRWYPAFGGVLKIIALFKGDDSNEIVPIVKGSSKKVTHNSDSFGTWQLILVAVSTAALVWLLVGLTLVCYKYRQTHCVECSSPCESPKSNCSCSENVNYCDPSNCPRKINRKNVGEKVKSWWKEKFKCRENDRCGRAREQQRYSAVNLCKSKEPVLTNVGKRVYKKRKKSRRSASISVSPCSSQYAFYENKQFHYSSDMSSTNSEDSSYR